MTKGKKIVAVAVCLAVVAGGTVGGTVIYRTQQTKKNRVDVMPVANLTQYWWGDDLSMDGQVVSGDVQNVTPSDDQMIAKVLVKEGDHVTKGTPLLDYDMTAVGLEVAQKQTALAVAQENVRKAQKELERLKKLRPSEEAPVVPDDPDYPDEPDEPDAPDTPDTPDSPKDTLAAVIALTQAAAGTGTPDDPYQFACTGQTVVTQAALEQLKAAKQCAVFVVYDQNGSVLYGWLVRGDQLTTTGDWTLGQNIKVTEDGGVQISGGGTWYGTLQVGGTFSYDPANNTPAETEPASSGTTGTTGGSTGTVPESSTASPDTQPDTQPADTDTSADPTAAVQPMAAAMPMAAVTPMASSGTDNDNYVYTRAQLKQKVAEQQIAIQSAQIDQKKAQIEYDAAAEKQEKGQELAKIDGVVTKVAASVESLEKNEPYLVVQGSGGVMVQGTVSEMNLDKLTVGATVTVNSWDIGEMLTAEVTEIDKTPTSYTNQNGSENPNNSAYPFKAAVTDSTSLSVGSYVSLSFSGAADAVGDTFYLPVSYVRQENGQYYVLRESKDKKLERQDVQTGKIINGGYAIEILSGVSQEDYICFPYGKYAVEGALVNETNGSSEY